MTNEAVQIGVTWPIDVKVPTANIVNSLVINHKGAVGMLQGGMSSKDGVVRFHYRGGNLGSRVDRKLQFGFLAIVD